MRSASATILSSRACSFSPSTSSIQAFLTPCCLSIQFASLRNERCYRMLRKGAGQAISGAWLWMQVMAIRCSELPLVEIKLLPINKLISSSMLFRSVRAGLVFCLLILVHTRIYIVIPSAFPCSSEPLYESPEAVPSFPNQRYRSPVS